MSALGHKQPLAILTVERLESAIGGRQRQLVDGIRREIQVSTVDSRAYGIPANSNRKLSPLVPSNEKFFPADR